MSPRNAAPRRAIVPARNDFATDAHTRLYPFTALVAQEELKLALLLNAIAPSIGGVLIMGHRGTGKTTIVRSLANLLPPLSIVSGCHFNCDPDEPNKLCADCQEKLRGRDGLPRARARAPIVELPLNATEDRVCGTLNFERALAGGVREFEPGLLARANRGFLYIDEVNLLEDHLVDVLLDAAATGLNHVEREGLSLVHPARFVLVGSGNPEEGELRPQLLDRFGLYAEVQTIVELDQRIEIVARRERFERDASGFLEEFQKDEARLSRRLVRARRLFDEVRIPQPLLRRIVELCLRLKVDGHRGELTIARAARSLAAFENRREATADDVRRVAPLALRHRLRRDPLSPTSGGETVERAAEEMFGTDATSVTPGEGMTKPEHQRARRSETNDEPDARLPAGPTARKHEDQLSPQSQAGEQPAPPVAGHLPSELKLSQRQFFNRQSEVEIFGRRRAVDRSTVESPRGRFTRAGVAPHPHGERRIALVPTLSAAVRARPFDMPAAKELEIKTGHLRFKRFSRKSGALFIFAVDASGSMAVNRIRQAKGALAGLLRQSYVNRDRVALISFREQRADVLLSPSQSPATCKRLLDALPVGGATPLSAALLRALEIARRTLSQHVVQITLLVFTDGRANVPLTGGTTAAAANVGRGEIQREVEQLGGALRTAGVSSIVIDTQSRFTAGDEGQALARALGGQYCQLPLA